MSGHGNGRARLGTKLADNCLSLSALDVNPRHRVVKRCKLDEDLMSTPPKQPNILQTATEETLGEIRTLIGSARHGALATLNAESGHPQCTRVGLATLDNGTPIIFVSALAEHTPALIKDKRCSLLVGEPGKGDPLAHPRATLLCAARPIDNPSPQHEAALQRYLGHHPKAKLYAELPDFRFFALEIGSVRYNGGFGRAFVVKGEELRV